MKSKKIFKPLYLIALTALVITSMAFMPKKSIQLKYNFDQGDKYNLEIKTTQNIAMNMSGQSMVLKQNILLNQTAEILNISEEGNIEFEIAYDRIRFDQNAMGMEISWDSENPEAAKDNMMAQQVAGQFEKALAEKINTTIDHYGNPVKNNSAEVLGNSSVSGFEMGMLVVFPDHEISVGESWEVTTQPDPNSDFTVNSTYTLTNIKGSTASISYDGTITGTEMNGNEAKLSGTITGKADVNTKTGWLESATTMQNLEMEMQQQGQTVPMSLSSVIELKSE